ncbi:MAG: hypothetical protein OEV14_03380, partial [Gammaproteobacteria bacterium]|nr:hypothetical protein [Gammaproteobacteria bacterium]
MQHDVRSVLRLSTGLLVIVSLMPMIASATRLSIRALLEDGSSAGAGVTVTVTNGQYSAQDQTGGNSRVTFPDVPEGSTTVTGQRANLQGQLTVAVSGRNQNAELTLKAPAAAPQPPSATLRINGGGSCTARPTVVLNNNVSGPAPKAYRSSEDRAAIRAAPWLLYTAAPTFELSAGAGTKMVYFQVQSSVSGSLLDSEVVSDAIDLVAPKAKATLAINNGAASTTNRTVTLNNQVTFDPAGTNPRYIASENPNFDGASWQTYSTAPEFTLSEGAVGTKTVHFVATREVCGTVVGTPSVSDSIQLNVEAAASTPIAPDPVITRHTFNWTTSVKPVDVVAYAVSQGFSFTNTRTGGSGACGRQGAHLTARPVVKTNTPAPTLTQYSALSCNWAMFGGRRLNTGWKSMSVTIKGSTP